MSAAIAVLLFGFAAAPVTAEMVLSQVIVDLLPSKPARDDIEILNDGAERMYVYAQPFEVLNSGTSLEKRVAIGDHGEAGLLVAPQRLVLEPGEHRTVRLSYLAERPSADRIFRIAIQPVGGPISSTNTALKVFVGYDALLIVRPRQLVKEIASSRANNTLSLYNSGNTAQELFDGRQCNGAGKDCRMLPAKRLYAGATWDQALPFDTPVTYKVAVGPAISSQQF